MKDQWYNNAVIYALDVETYRDSNSDGIGDFHGLMEKLHHLSGLGINCLWLRPFFSSPLADDGYDVMDYYSIDSRFGNLGDFVEFVAQARALGIRIIIDLVVNHTSIEHEWFKKAREDKNSKYRNYYIWKSDPGEEDQYSNMLGKGGIWSYDKKAGEYYMHHFLIEQPDLNISNPEVRREIKKIMGFWLQLGASGFRIDSAHIIVHESKDQVFYMLEEMRDFINKRNHDAILIGEVNVETDDLPKFFGNGHANNRLHLLFNFHTNKSLFLSMARENPDSLIKSLKEIENIEGEWVNFIRTHDELNLQMLTKNERDEVFAAFGPEENMKIFDHGIRRRLPPMLKGDRKRIELMYVIMFSLPGVPLINYGSEIAMGDDLSQPGRESVRTAMQWDDLDNAGFSEAPANTLVHPVIKKGEYSYKKVNVRLQQKDSESFFNWMERLISTHKHSPQLIYGKGIVLKNNNDSVFSFFNVWKSDALVLLHNLSSSPCKVKLIAREHEFRNFSEIFSDQRYADVNSVKQEIELSAYGYRWFRSKYNKV